MVEWVQVCRVLLLSCFVREASCGALAPSDLPRSCFIQYFPALRLFFLPAVRPPPSSFLFGTRPSNLNQT